MSRKLAYLVTYSDRKAAFLEYSDAMRYAEHVSQNTPGYLVQVGHKSGLVGQYLNGRTTPEFQSHHDTRDNPATPSRGTRHVFVAPDGKRLQRTSKTRSYSHAVLFRTRNQGWQIAACVSRPDLAASRLREWLKCGHEAILVEAQK